MDIFRQLSAINLNLHEFPFKSELNLESTIIENLQIIENDTFHNAEIITSQLSLIQGRKNGDGRIDLLAKAEDSIIIIEVKKGKVTKNHVSQLEDYLEAIKSNKEKLMGLITSDKSKQSNMDDFEWYGLLV